MLYLHIQNISSLFRDFDSNLISTEHSNIKKDYIWEMFFCLFSPENQNSIIISSK